MFNYVVFGLGSVLFVWESCLRFDPVFRIDVRCVEVYRIDVRCWCSCINYYTYTYIILLYIIHYYYYIPFLPFLFFCSSSSSIKGILLSSDILLPSKSPNLSLIPSFYSSPILQVYLSSFHSIRVDGYLYLFMFQEYSDPACFIGVDG